MRSVSVRLGAMALTVIPNGPSSKASLRVKRDDAALRGGICAAAGQTQPAPRNGSEIDDLAMLAPLHHRRHRMAEQERAVQVELDQLLPFIEGQFVHGGAGPVDDRTAADGIDQDVDPTKFLRDGGDRRRGLSRIKRVAEPTVSRAAGAA